MSGEVGFRTPLLDLFVRGEAPPEARRLAAEGALAPRAHEQLALLMLLSSDSDPSIREAAEKTISRLPAGPVGRFLVRPEASSELRAFFGSRGFAVAQSFNHEEASLGEADETTKEEAAPPPADVHQPVEATARDAAVNRLARLNITERMKVALQGTREERSILVRDPNRMVAVSVLSSPKLTESEVESIARMGNVSEDVLRIVGTTRAWVKNYNVVVGLTRNAKTPLAISMTLMSRLNARDMRLLSTDRNVPEPLRIAARKQVVLGDSRKH
jgi:hypothetical protein